ncbi:histidine kinase dimerization/phospho-acceptor domain-containing protein [Anaeromyxobacter paludicola]|uniref:histidine kinase n=1 Tax=Anaeromyxobacter paludicola TaxID=2918171 RepID=A0ABN6N3M0_9BACT|nr:histidine kinase dimerization/phospho-acceptor domain-containing protein [Anaeromyxobacter paludicola]BDG07797.1 hypothetical protein AMPC_09100 [Anaeromyxobacter paludicola]
MAEDAATLEGLHVEALTRLAGGVAHDVKNPLNAMALQLALLGDKVAGGGDGVAQACAQNLASLKTQIGRVDEVMRRFLSVADPSAEGNWLDLAAYAPDAVTLFGHEARRRGVELRCEAPSMPLRARCAPSAGARLVLALLLEAVSSCPPGSRILLSASAAGGEVRVALTRPAGGSFPGLLDAVRAGAEQLGGRLTVTAEGDVATRVLSLLGERTT